jgi:hypothetical protein
LPSWHRKHAHLLQVLPLMPLAAEQLIKNL